MLLQAWSRSKIDVLCTLYSYASSSRKCYRRSFKSNYTNLTKASQYSPLLATKACTNWIQRQMLLHVETRVEKYQDLFEKTLRNQKKRKNVFQKIPKERRSAPEALYLGGQWSLPRPYLGSARKNLPFLLFQELSYGSVVPNENVGKYFLFYNKYNAKIFYVEFSQEVNRKLHLKLQIAITCFNYEGSFYAHTTI